ncbi:adenine deaminase C-terminal domain-containing protein, partial [Enterococcus faecium]|uniref:adenine deaminase C-terminal domain-containing protein n=1 Tax=Enterococcus faecium TaxID=1352 RepID=UPI0030C84E42
SSTGDIILIGKNKNDMQSAFNRMKEIGGGIVIYESGQSVYELPLTLTGTMSDQPIEELISLESNLYHYLKDKGYPFIDPIYSLMFFSATHLPYIRVTQHGIYDVMNKTVLFPTIMR